MNVATARRGGAVATAHALAVALILASAAFTVWMCLSMAGGMPMPGGWEMSMAWMPMGSQGWAAATAMFLAMWLAMMVAMMLPSALPVLLLYRRTLAFRGDPAAGRKAFLAGSGYFGVWLGFGALAFVAGVALTQAAMADARVSRAVPAMAAATLIAAGLYQLTPWKSACLKHCRGPFEVVHQHLAHAPWRLGLHHGAWCAGCCVGIMAVQLVLGVMNLAAMALVAVWIALEKLTPIGPAVARASGLAAIAAGGWLLAGGR